MPILSLLPLVESRSFSLQEALIRLTACGLEHIVSVIEHEFSGVFKGRVDGASVPLV